MHPAKLIYALSNLLYKMLILNTFLSELLENLLNASYEYL